MEKIHGDGSWKVAGCLWPDLGTLKSFAKHDKEVGRNLHGERMGADHLLVDVTLGFSFSVET